MAALLPFWSLPPVLQPSLLCETRSLPALLGLHLVTPALDDSRKNGMHYSIHHNNIRAFHACSSCLCNCSDYIRSKSPSLHHPPCRCRKCHACHAKDRGATSVLLRRQASADIYGGTESTTPATQIEPEVPKVPRLPRKRPRRHISPTSSPSFR